MKFYTSLLFVFILTITSRAQVRDGLGVWVDHLSYSTGVDVMEVNNKVYSATAQGIWAYDLDERTIERVSKVNGLSDVGITAFEWSEEYSLFFIGYENGNIDLMTLEHEVSNFPDIRQTRNYTGLKQINDIAVRDNMAYICTNFGIVAYNIDLEVAEETFIIGSGGDVVVVNQVALSEDSIYAATPDGILAANLQSDLFFFGNWGNLSPRISNAKHIAFFSDKLFVTKYTTTNNDSILYKEKNSSSWSWLTNSDISNISFLKNRREVLATCNVFNARGFNTNLEILYNMSGSSVEDMDFIPQAASRGGNTDNFWIIDNNEGLLHNYQGIYNFVVTPNAPASPDISRMYVGQTKLYVAPAPISFDGAPNFNNDGFFVLEEFNWTNYPSSSFEDYRDITAIIEDPADPSHIFASAYNEAILEFRDNQLVRIINEETTDGAMPAYNTNGQHRIVDFAADSEGNIWFPNGLTDQPLCRLNPETGEVHCFSLGSAASGGADVREILYTSQNQVWLQINNEGLVVANATNALEGATPSELPAVKLLTSEGSGNIPSTQITSFAEDLDGEIWIGSIEGLSVLYSPQNIFEANRNYDASPIIIANEDGSGSRVLGGETVNDIAVDGSNKKWLATQTAGVFYLNENGQEQVEHFTKDNSPLLSDNIIDIAIDGETGQVNFGTDRGIVSYQGTATDGSISMNNVTVYPNPVEPGYGGLILIRGLVTNAQVKVTDVEGNLVFETVAEGGQATWTGRNFDGLRVASGVYLAYITDDLGQVTNVSKILIIN